MRTSWKRYFCIKKKKKQRQTNKKNLLMQRQTVYICLSADFLSCNGGNDCLKKKKRPLGTAASSSGIRCFQVSIMYKSQTEQQTVEKKYYHPALSWATLHHNPFKTKVAGLDPSKGRNQHYTCLQRAGHRFIQTLSTHLVHLSDCAELRAKILEPLDLGALGLGERLQLPKLLLTLGEWRA